MSSSSWIYLPTVTGSSRDIYIFITTAGSLIHRIRTSRPPHSQPVDSYMCLWITPRFDGITLSALLLCCHRRSHLVFLRINERNQAHIEINEILMLFTLDGYFTIVYVGLACSVGIHVIALRLWRGRWVIWSDILLWDRIASCWHTFSFTSLLMWVFHRLQRITSELFTHQFNFYNKCIRSYQRTNQAAILYITRQMVYRGMCKIVAWADGYLYARSI